MHLAFEAAAWGEKPWKSHSEAVRGPWHGHRDQERVLEARRLKRT